MRARDLVHVGTRSALWPSQSQQGANLLKSEPEVAGSPDESQCPCFGWSVDPSAARRSGRRRQHFDPLVIADGLDGPAALLGQLTDRDVFGSQRRDGAHEIVLDPLVTTGCMV